MGYFFGFAFIISFGFFLAGYKKYGKGGFLGEGGGRCLWDIFCIYIKNENRLIKKRREVYVESKEETEQWWRETCVKVFAHSILFIMVFSAIGFLVFLQGNYNKGAGIELSRDSFDGDSISYGLKAVWPDESTENMEIEISPREYSDKQIDEMFEEGFEQAWRNMLGKNKSFNQITQPVNLITSLDEFPLKFSWWWEPEEFVSEEGDIQYDKIDGTAILTMYLQAEYRDELRQQSKTLLLSKPVYSKKELKLKQIAEQFLKWDSEDKEKESVLIPDEFEGIRLYPSDSKDNTVLFLFIVIFAPVLFILKEYQDLNYKVEERHKELQREYPNLVNRLVLYMGAGMTIKATFDRLYDEYCKEEKLERDTGKKVKTCNYLYNEIGRMIQEWNAGASEETCYEMLGKRLGLNCYVKLTAILIQNLSKGSAGILPLLLMERKQALNDQRDRVRKFGEETGTKLLIPMMILLIVSLIIVMVPAFLSFG